jgi:choline dehydrogenase-like flavoprotein
VERLPLGCQYGIKWDSSVFIREASNRGAEIVHNCRAKRISFNNSRATGVITNNGFIPADMIIVAAGGLNTPHILENSGIKTDERLFVDPVLCVAAEHKNSFQNRELPMPFAVQMVGYIISPYFDRLSLYRKIKYVFCVFNLTYRDLCRGIIN